MDRFTAMQVFARVVDTGSFTRAAEAMDLPKASVSAHVARLERHLGVRLLERSSRGIRLTEAGAVYHDRIQRLLSELGELETGLAAANQRPGGRLRVDVPSAVGVHVLAPALAEFRALYPDIRLEVGSSDRPVDLLGEGVDCVIRGGDVFDESLVGRRLETLGIVALATPDYLARHGTPTHPDQLRDGHAMVGYFSTKTGKTSPFTFARGAETVTIEGPFDVAFNDANAYLAGGLAGLGVMQMPYGAWIRGLVDEGRLVRILADWTAEPLIHTILYPSRHHLSARVQVFVEWALKRLGSG